MKSYNVSIQLKPLWQISYIILFISYLYLFLEIFAAVTFKSEKFRMGWQQGVVFQFWWDRFIFKGFLFFFCQKEIKDITDLDRPKNCGQSTSQPRWLVRVLSYPSLWSERLRETDGRENLGTRLRSGMVTSLQSDQ